MAWCSLNGRWFSFSVCGRVPLYQTWNWGEKVKNCISRNRKFEKSNQSSNQLNFYSWMSRLDWFCNSKTFWKFIAAHYGCHCLLNFFHNGSLFFIVTLQKVGLQQWNWMNQQGDPLGSTLFALASHDPAHPAGSGQVMSLPAQCSLCWQCNFHRAFVSGLLSP